MKQAFFLTGAACAAVCAAAAAGQSLFQRAPGTPGALEPREPAAPLYGVSLYAIQPPRPRQFAPHDLVTIVVNETSSAKRSQTVETEKAINSRIELATLDAISRFIELRGNIPTGTIDIQPLLDVEKEFEGEGEYERKDDILARITAEVLEVKPNGNILLEARSSITTDGERQTIVLSGICRGQDVTEANTIISSQLYDLNLVFHHEGELKSTTEKGLIPKALDALFAF